MTGRHAAASASKENKKSVSLLSGNGILYTPGKTLGRIACERPSRRSTLNGHHVSLIEYLNNKLCSCLPCLIPIALKKVHST